MLAAAGPIAETGLDMKINRLATQNGAKLKSENRVNDLASIPIIIRTASRSPCGRLRSMTAAAYLVLLERWIAAWVQDRMGPNRVGIPLTKIRVFGLGQPLADGMKFIFKEEYTPAHVDKVLYFLAPMSILSAAMAIFAVIPFGSVLPDSFLPASWGVEQIKLVVAPGIDVGMIYVFALGSIAVYGVILGGWASNNKYSFLGGLRSSAQLIAYELPLGLGILGVVLAAGSLAAGHDHRASGRNRGLERLHAAAGLHVSSASPPLPRRRGCRSTCPRPSRS